MNKLFEKHSKKLASTSLYFVRGIMNQINWNARLIGIRGARGVGKTTLLLQYIKKYLPNSSEALYANLDDIWFSENNLVDLVDDFVKQGGRYLFLDEVHKYNDWSKEIKNIYDDHPELYIVFTGSSLLEILDARADLSRRAVIYQMQGLSFREFLNFSLHTNLRIFSFEEILSNHIQLSEEVLDTIKPLKYFGAYLQKGYYPFFKEVPELYHSRLEEILNMIIYIELPLLRGVDIHFSSKLKQLLLIISESAPFIPNINKLSEKIKINRNTLISYLRFLEEAGIILRLYRKSKGISRMQKPDKIFLENTNIAFAVNTSSPNAGNLRETFFFNQLKYQHYLTFPKTADFMVDDSWFIEVGGKNKTGEQINHLSKNKAFLAIDNIEYGYMNHIPLWMFGFLY